MRGEIVELEDGERVIVGKIAPIGKRSYCLEIHRAAGEEKDSFKVMHVLLTEADLRELAAGIVSLLER